MVESRIEEPGELKSAWVNANGTRLHYLAWDPEQQEALSAMSGSEGMVQAGDEIPLVMLHGLGTTAAIWQLVAPYLCHHHLVIAFDLRGHGESDAPEGGYDFVTVAEDVVYGMAGLGLGKIALVGHGWGARVALVLAVRHPALVSHLILVDCPLVEPKHWPGMTRTRFIRQKPAPAMYASRAAYLSATQDEMSDFWSPAIEAILLTFVRELANGTLEERLQPEQQRQIRQSLWEEQALPYYSKVRCPVLLIPAAAQPLPGGQPPEKLENAAEFAAAKGYMAAQVARIIPNCTVLWMPNTAHDIQFHRPQRLAAAIASFVREQ
jgi:pimeloyl-ACP methyl ester carboxylesterase